MRNLSLIASGAIRDVLRKRRDRPSAECWAIFRLEILAYMRDLYDWALATARGEKFWHDSQPLEWSREVERFFAALKKFDDYLASSEPLHASIEKLFQGPIADSLTHIGQIAMLRRIAGYPLKGENYFIADISIGRVGVEQAAPRREFD